MCLQSWLLQKLRQEHHEFKARLGNRVRPCLQTKFLLMPPESALCRHCCSIVIIIFSKVRLSTSRGINPHNYIVTGFLGLAHCLRAGSVVLNELRAVLQKSSHGISSHPNSTVPILSTHLVRTATHYRAS